ncbi:MAG: dodecin domain-containing protein [Gammaproteobacteria bacterium]|nr:dodecin domain-containing protein [Gammaproteobacteria bacterium]MCP5425762.1 dodecin domain-containing protein [Gammaproteobacteria bacterium]MCP5458627.1 dodecin domain-containing protein [Gammaproteobacteria bacterium]
MTDPVYKLLELTGTSSKSLEDAVQNAIGHAAKTVRNIRWFEVTGTRGYVDDGVVKQWQVSLKVGFSLEDSD